MTKLLSALITFIFLTTTLPTANAQEETAPATKIEKGQRNRSMPKMSKEDIQARREMMRQKRGPKGKKSSGKSVSSAQSIETNYQKKVQQINEIYAKRKSIIEKSERPENIKSLLIKQSEDRRDLKVEHQKELKTLKENQLKTLQSTIKETKAEKTSETPETKGKVKGKKGGKMGKGKGKKQNNE